MPLFGSKTPQERELTAAERRAKTLPTHELPSWAHTCLYTIGRTLSEYEREPDPGVLSEARLSTETLLVLLQEMEERRTRW